MTFQPDSSQLKALESWYLPDNPLYKEARHPVIKLAGEAGELLDLYGKNEYKPNFSWWNCKHCGYGDASHSLDGWKTCPYLSKADENIMRGAYTPLVFDELGDWSYYARILCWQKEVSFEAICQEFDTEFLDEVPLENLLSLLNVQSADILQSFLVRGFLGSIELLEDNTNIFLAILSKLDTSLEQVLDLNYKKLNSEATKHGWQNAR